MKMSWPFGKRDAHDSADIDDAYRASVTQLADVKALRRQTQEVSSSLRESRAVNHFGDGIHVAFGGSL